ncbi:MAG: VWA domain-containing protein [Verrucomicrobiae bacterium]|nr:VWA domain-containing protein [Verrucomicrobiae bacterium]
MTFASPQFFILLPLLAVIGWYFRRLELWRPLRAAGLLLLVFALANPQIRRLADGMDLWVLIDRSASAEEIVARNIEEWKRLLDRSRPSSKDRLHFVDYATEVVSKPNTETASYPGDRSLTRTALALQDAIALSDRERHSRILVFTDGYATEPLTGLPEKLEEMQIPLDYRLLTSDETTDFRITDFHLPSRSQVGEPFIMDVNVTGNVEAEVPLRIARDGEIIADTKTTISAGLDSLRFTDRLVEPGSHHYEVTILPETDAHQGNNRYEAWIEIAAGPRVLLISKYADDPVAGILRAQGFDVDLIDDPGSLTVGQLTGAKNVILNNVPAWDIPTEFLKALDFFVNEQGGGLLMAGGKHSFGAGGYYESSVDPLLPVTMELKSEHRKLAVAMAIVMDRSGSMGMTTSSGHTKMQLADEGAGRAVELLGPQDLVAVNAVDSTSHEIVPLINVGQHRAEIINRVRRIESMGGGIFVYTGLKAAWDQLKQADIGQRHIILFSDAADSEEPGAYRTLVEEMVKEGASVSVIGLGTKSDPDAAFIEDIAKRGNGRMFFTDIPGDLPNIFAQETVTVARSTFIDEPVATQATGSWYEIGAKDFEWLGEVDGYNLSYTREGDAAALISKDEYAAPLVAYARRGIGRSAAVSFPLGGEFSDEIRAWPKVGDFVQTLNRWLMGEQTPPGIGIRHELTGTELKIDLLYDETEWNERFAARPPRVVLARGEGAERSSELTWERLAPGHFSVRADLKEGEMIRGAVQVGQTALPFGPVVVGTSTEWAFDPERVAELRATSEISGGRELLDLSEAWKKPERKDFTSLQPWLLSFLLLLVLADALVTRTGWHLPEFTLLKERFAKSVARKVKSKAEPKRRTLRRSVPTESSTESLPGRDGLPGRPLDEEPPPAPPAEKSAEEKAEERKTRFNRAKRGR